MAYTKGGTKPVVRQVEGRDGQVFLAEVRGADLRLRPLGARQADATISITWDQIYTRALLSRVQVAKRSTKRVSRGLLSVERRAQ